MNAPIPRPANPIAPAIGNTGTGLSPYFNSGAGTCVMVNESQRKILDAMYAMAAKPSSQGYHALSMTKAVERLRAGGDLPNAQFQPHRPQRRCLVHSGFEIEYEVVPGIGGQGTIEIVEIRATLPDVVTQKRSGLWQASYEGANGWTAKHWLPDLAKVPADATLKVGVNGLASGIDDAARVLSSQVARGDAAKLEALKSSGYHLFYTPVKKGVKAGWCTLMNSLAVHRSENDLESAKILAAYMHDAHERSLTVEWTSHRGGSFVLTEAMKLLAAKKVDLQKKQSIYLSDPASSYGVADKYRRQLNMNITDFKWVGGGYGISHFAVAGNFGLSKLQTEWAILSNDTTADNVVGKSFTFARNVTKVGHHTMAVGGLTFAAYAYAGLNGAFAAVLLKLAPLIASSIPSFTEDFQKHEGQAMETAINMGVNKIRKLVG